METDSIDSLMIKICESLPFDITLFEKEGFCYKPNDLCRYCHEYSSEESKALCYKNTKISNTEVLDFKTT